MIRPVAAATPIHAITVSLSVDALPPPASRAPRAGWPALRDRGSRAADNQAGDKNQDAAQDHLNKRRGPRRIHVMAANPGNRHQLNQHDDNGDARGEVEAGGIAWV